MRNISYSQFGEDVILSSLLEGRESGFYVDIGANSPDIDSVTRYFYQKGWRGINVEPIPYLYEELAKARSRDININCGVGSTRKRAVLRTYLDQDGHSTLSEERKATEHDSNYVDIDIEVVPLRELLKDQINIPRITFMKIDVEGYEGEVLMGNDWKKYRPEIICIESNNGSNDWHQLLINNRYDLFIFDGLNRYYISEESWYLTNSYAESAVKRLHNTVSAQVMKEMRDMKKTINLLRKDNTKISLKLKELADERDKMSEYYRLSLFQRSLPQRIIRSIYGLTVDWLRFKTSKR